MKRNNVVALIPFEECTGCGACKESCPKHCISLFSEGEAGFLHPRVDVASCIDCGVCVKRCPLNHSAKNLVQNVYGAFVNDRKLLRTSNSGGIFSCIAEYFLTHNGFVCGAAFTDELEVKHIVISKQSDLYRLQGSKYVQSESSYCFPKLKKLLQAGKNVLFCGTGCQVAGLKSYLIHEYDSLLTIELVCHGVSSPTLFSKYLAWLGERHGGKVSQYKFRSKEIRPTGEHSQFYYIVNGIKYVGQSYEDPYYGSFLAGKTLRDSCYHCHFKGNKRVGDLTVGDFWGIEKKHSDFPIKNGTSLVMINSQKGTAIFNKIANKLTYVLSNYDEAILRNPSIAKPTRKPNKMIDYSAQDLFEEKLKPKLSLKDKIKNRLPWQVKWFLKRYF